MQIVTDRGSDFAINQAKGFNIHFAPMRLTLDGKTYSSGEDISAEQFYDLLEQTPNYPTTSQATTGDFAQIYKHLAESDPEILSIHISSGLSGTLASAQAAAEMVPEAKITFWDTKGLSCMESWQVEAAARALQSGWPIKRILEYLERIRARIEGTFTLDTLKYLIHGGRISHIKGLLASLLNIKPVIGVEKEKGRYETRGQERTMRKALQSMAKSLLKYYPLGSDLRVQLLHGKNPEAVAILKEDVTKLFNCYWEPTVTVGPILGAHTGKSVVGLVAAPLDLFQGLMEKS